MQRLRTVTSHLLRCLTLGILRVSLDRQEVDSPKDRDRDSQEQAALPSLGDQGLGAASSNVAAWGLQSGVRILWMGMRTGRSTTPRQPACSQEDWYSTAPVLASDLGLCLTVPLVISGVRALFSG